MDKRVIFSVAGSGKTTHIVNKLDLESPVIIITYTNNNVENIRERILKKFGYFPSNIKLQSYFSFLHGFCYKPFLSGTLKTKGLYYKPNTNRFAKNDAQYITSNGRLYSNRLAKFIESKGVIQDVIARLEKYYKNVLFDEIQDFAGNDFNLIKNIAKANVNITMVGDFYQHTFDTSRDGSVNKSLHDDFTKYQKQFADMGFTIDTTTLNKSYRCSPTICNFITEKLGISIDSHRDDPVSITIIEKKEEAESILKNDEIVKLFYQKHYAHNCHSRNWGDCKGEDRYNDVCIVLNKTTLKSYKEETLQNLAPSTKNKLYVACSRAKNNLYILSEELFKA